MGRDGEKLRVEAKTHVQIQTLCAPNAFRQLFNDIVKPLSARRSKSFCVKAELCKAHLRHESSREVSDLSPTFFLFVFRLSRSRSRW